MSGPKLVSKVGALETWHLPSEQRGKMTLVNRADVTTNLNANDRERSMGGSIHPAFGRKVASIDVVTIGAWLDEAGITWREFWQQWEPGRRRKWLAERVNSRAFYRLKTADRNI